MIRWVVTGPAGAGKSALTALLAERGAALLDGDRLGHEILAQPEVADAIASRFGPECVRAGVVDRRRLGAIVFADPAALAGLNAITHPPLARLMRRRLDELETAKDHPLAVLEAAVYFLLPSPPRADLTITVTASPMLRRRRLIAGGLTAEQADHRIASQVSLEEGFARSDLTIFNEGTRAELAARVDELIRTHAPGFPAFGQKHDKDGTQ